MRPSPRIRRLKADYRSVCQLRDDSKIFSFECSGTPPQKYELHFKGVGFYRHPESGKVEIRNNHRVTVNLVASYPRMMPSLVWQTPIFHPNISTNGVVCMGGYGSNWVPSLTLDEMITMLWDMIRYKNFDSDSPYNRAAAAWTKSQMNFKFPVDTRSIRDRVSNQTNENLTLNPPKKNKPLKKRKASSWGILSRLVSTEPPLPTHPVTTDHTPVTAPTAIDTSANATTPANDGIQIIEATLVEPTTPPTTDPSAQEGIVFLS